MDPVKAAYPRDEVEVCSYRPNGRFSSSHPQEFAMADLAFVATTIAVFALVALIARAVTRS
ncbi:hypothetical protein [Streptomyces globisporus]|uniref:hypothetical protein n=1 Tax=Streptomyces globisporus TaxID=1908 RepID=UPI0037A55E0A